MTQFFNFVTYEDQVNPGFPFNDYADYQIVWPWATYPQSSAEIIDYYANLLILQYVGEPRAYATVQTVVTGVVMDQLPLSVENAFEIGTAVGAQLDILGKYVGVTRSGYGPQGFITLNDSDFTTFIQLAIVNNRSDASLASIQQLLHTYFNGEIFVFDNQDMQLSYYLNSDSTSLDLATLFVTEGLLPKPLGVQLAAVIYAPGLILTSFFGCRTYELPAVNDSPLNSYASYQLTYPFLTYKDALVIDV